MGRRTDWSDDGSATDVQATITHEIGHALGIDHSDIPDATMYFEILGNAVHQRSLDDDDEKAVSHLYSDRVLGVPTVLTCNSVSAAGATPWGLLALLTLIRRKRQTENSP